MHVIQVPRPDLLPAAGAGNGQDRQGLPDPVGRIGKVERLDAQRIGCLDAQRFRRAQAAAIAGLKYIGQEGQLTSKIAAAVGSNDEGRGDLWRRDHDLAPGLTLVDVLPEHLTRHRTERIGVVDQEDVAQPVCKGPFVDARPPGHPRVFLVQIFVDKNDVQGEDGVGR